MDTKSLYDLANEANIGFQDDESYQDARELWIDAYMKSPELLADLWIDALCEAKEDYVTEILKNVGSTHKSIHLAQTESRHSIGMAIAAGSSVTQGCSFIGGAVYKSILAFVTEYVGSECENWWGDCQGYHSDMMESQAEDSAYENWKDRRLEG